MKKHLLLLLGILIALPAFARDFDYTYEGKTITYTVIDEHAKTVKTKIGSGDEWTPGNEVSGTLILPPRVYDGNGVEYTLTELGSSAFADCRDLESVTLPKTIVTLGSGAFSRCKKLKYVKLSEGIEQIKSRAFYDCESLRRATIPSSVTSIGDKGFYGCDSLKTFIFASSQKEIVFDGYALGFNVDSMVINRNLSTLSGANPIHVVIGEGVDSIAASFFGNRTSLLSVSLPSTLKSIGKEAFRSCSNLGSIDFPSSLTEIGESAFSNCGSLKSIVLPNKLVTIPSSAFSGCVMLRDVILPDNLEKIEKYAFRYSKSLRRISIPGTVTSIEDYAFSGIDSMKTFTFEPSQKEIKFGTGALGWTDSLIINRKLPSNGGSSPTHVVFGEGVDSIAPTIFSHNSFVRSLSLPSTLKYIGENAFKNCYNIEKVDFSSPLTLTESAKLEIGAYAFAGCSGAKSIKLPKSLVTIGSNAFASCDKLAEAILPEGLEQIKYRAFYNCKSLRRMTIPGNVTSIGGSAFQGCDSIKTLTFASSQKELVFDGYALGFNVDSLVMNRKLPQLSGADPKYVVIGEGVDSIAANLFSGRTSILSVILPSTLKSIGEKAFSSCSNLGSIDLPSSLTKIGASAFSNCGSLKSIVLPNTLVTIPSSAFSGCVMLRDVILPDNLEKIEKYAFSYSKSLRRISIPGTVTSIEDYAFSGIDSMKTFTLERSQKEIKFGTGALGWTDSLIINRYIPTAGGSSPKHVIFGEGIDSIATRMFYRSNIHSVSLPSTLKYIDKEAFQNCYKLESVNFTEPMTETDSVGLEIGAYAFAGCSGVESIKLPKSLVTIGSNSFTSCDKLTEAILPEGLEQIKYRAFYNCKSLRRMTIPGNVISIGGSAFQGCDSIKTFTFASSQKELVFDGYALGFNVDSMVINRKLPTISGANPIHVVIGEGVDSIAENLFRGRTSILTVNLPSTLKSIGKEAFNNCTNIDSIFSEAKVPPTCENDNVFAWATYPKAMVTVPVGSRRKYATAEVWKNFANIRTEGSLPVTVTYNHEMGEVTLNGEAVDSLELDEGEPLDVAVNPATGFDIESVTANGEDCTDKLVDHVLHYDEISDTLALAVKFTPIIFDITIPDSIKGGHIEVNGSADAPAQLQYGSRVELRPVADEGYLLKTMTVNGTEVTLNADSLYVIDSLTENIAVDAVFEIIRYKATAKYDSAMGAVTLNGESGDILVDYGTSLTIVATPADGHYVGGLKVNGAAVNHDQLTEPVIIERVTEDIAVEVDFDIYRYAVTATYDNTLGSVSINGSEGAADVDWGADAAVVITPAYGYQIASVELDGSDVTGEVNADGLLTIKSVKADHSLTVAFEVKRVRLSMAMVGGAVSTLFDFGTELRYMPEPERGWNFHSATVGTEVIMSLDSDGCFLVGPLTDDTTVSVVFSNATTSANSLEEQTITVTVREHTVVIAGAPDEAIAEVYDAAGLRYYSGLERSIALDKAGVYIVTISGQSFKVLLR